MHLVVEDNIDIHYHRIKKQLYLGNFNTALHEPTLQKENITHILTVASEPIPSSELTLLSRKYMYIEGDDYASTDLLSHFDRSYNFIQEAITSGGSVYVHCYFGVSRSATLVAAYLMKKYGLNAKSALYRLKQKRSCASPNEGFLLQLDLYHKLNCSLEYLNRRSFLYRKYKYDMVIAAVRIEPHKLRPMIVDYMNRCGPDDTEPPAVCCKHCGMILCRKSDVIYHNSEKDGSGAECDKSMSFLPQDWMKNNMMKHTHRMANQILCPHCQKHIGEYHWFKGVQCLCNNGPSEVYKIFSSEVNIHDQSCVENQDHSNVQHS